MDVNALQVPTALQIIVPPQDYVLPLQIFLVAIAPIVLIVPLMYALQMCARRLVILKDQETT